MCIIRGRRNYFCALISIYNCCILEISKQSILWSNGKQPPLASLIPARVSDSDSPQPNLAFQSCWYCVRLEPPVEARCSFAPNGGGSIPASRAASLVSVRAHPIPSFSEWEPSGLSPPTPNTTLPRIPPSAQTERPPIAQWLGTPSTLNSPPSLSHFTNILWTLLLIIHVSLDATLMSSLLYIFSTSWWRAAMPISIIKARSACTRIHLHTLEISTRIHSCTYIH